MRESFYRPEGALLAGVCAELAQRLGWNVWAIRALFLAALFFKTVAAGIVYAVLAVAMGLLLGDRNASQAAGPGGLGSERLRDRGQRIADLEKKFRELDGGHGE